MATFENVQTRFLYLIGEDSSSITDTHKSHINAAIQDIINAFPFSWNITSTNITLSSGTANLPSTSGSAYNPKWRIADARIVSSSDQDDNVFTEIPLERKDDYTSDDYIYWITYDTSTEKYIFNSKTQSGTVNISYYFVPADLSSTGDTLLVPDTEAVALLAASKNWVGDERNTKLGDMYEQKAGIRIQKLYTDEAQFGPVHFQGTPIAYNSRLKGS